MVKNVPAVQKTWVRSLGWEDPLKKGMATHSETGELSLKYKWTLHNALLLNVAALRLKSKLLINRPLLLDLTQHTILAMSLSIAFLQLHLPVTLDFNSLDP